jgi:hypothetical protein
MSAGRRGSPAERVQAQAGETVGPTPERLKQAVAAGEVIDTVGAGEERHWRVSPVLPELKRRKTISDATLLAFSRFLREYYLGLYAGPKAFGYSEKTSRSASGSAEFYERRVHYARETQRAILAVDPYYKVALEWVVSTLGESTPLSAMGKHYAPGLGAQTQSAKAGMVLEMLGACMCRHYGITHRLIDPRFQTLAEAFLALEQQA